MQKILKFLTLIVILSLFCLSCGTKGAPSLRAFEKPAPVMELRAAHRGGELIISWSYPSDKREALKGFLVEKSEDGAFMKTASLEADASVYRDSDFREGKEYTYRLRAVSLREVLSDDSPLLEVRPSVLPPPPGGISYRLTSDEVLISWNPAGAGVLYNLYRTKARGEQPSAPLNKEPLAEPVFRTRVETEMPLYYTVRCLLPTVLTDEGFPSEELAVDPANFVPSGPSELRYIPLDKGVYLTWKENEETWSRGYRIYRKQEGEKLFAGIGESPVPAFHDREPLTGKTLYFVTALGPVTESVPSEIIEAEKRKEQ